MAVAATEAGFSTGLRSGLADARMRRIQDEQLRRQAARDDLANQATQLELDNARVDAPRRRAREDLQTQTAQLDLDRATRQAAREPDDQARRQRTDDLNYQTGQLNLSDARTASDRATAEYNRQQAELKRHAEDTGLADFVRELEAGADPQFAMQRYNQRGVHKISNVDYDPTSQNLKVTSPDGKGFTGTLPQLKQILGVTPALTKLGKDDRLIDPRTLKEVVGPSVETDAEGNTGAPGSRKTSPYNPETVQKQIEAGIVRSRGGGEDVLGNYSISNPEDRQLVDYMVGLGHGMEGRLRKHVAAGRVTPGAIVDAVTEATRDMPTESQFAAKTEAWRKAGDHSQDEAANWLQAERQKQQASVTARLAAKEQAWLGQKGPSDAPTDPQAVTQKPDWAGDAVPSTVVGSAKLDPGYEYDVTIDGKPATIRVAPDGQVYKVGSGGKPPAAAPRRAAARPVDASAPADVAEPVTPAEAAPAVPPGNGRAAPPRATLTGRSGVPVTDPMSFLASRGKTAPRKYGPGRGVPATPAAPVNPVSSALEMARRNREQFEY